MENRTAPDGFGSTADVHADPFQVAAVVYEAITTESPRLRYPCSWGGPEVLEGRRAMSDEEWVDLGRITDTVEYRERFKSAFGVDITPPT